MFALKETTYTTFGSFGKVTSRDQFHICAPVTPNQEPVSMWNLYQCSYEDAPVIGEGAWKISYMSYKFCPVSKLTNENRKKW